MISPDTATYVENPVTRLSPSEFQTNTPIRGRDTPRLNASFPTWLAFTAATVSGAVVAVAMTQLQVSIFQMCGVLGAGLYVLSYSLLQLNALPQDARAYSALNLVAASLVALSLFDAFNLATALIQSMWIALSVLGLLKPAARS